MLFDDCKVFTIKDIFGYTKENNRKMLSEYNADFWQAYKANYQYFDRLFMKRFTSWFPFDQDPDDGLQSIQEDFAFDVYSHLLANDKRYSELWRVNVIADDDAYSLTNNVDYTETMDKDTTAGRTFNKGAQSDSTTIGQQSNSNTGSKTYGATSETETGSVTYGAHETDTTNTVSAFNADGYVPKDKQTVDDKLHTDSTSNTTTGEQHVDSETGSHTFGSRQDSHTEGARQDTTSDTGSEDYTLHKVGNMGVQTVDDMLLKHWDNWTAFNFYEMVFDEIAANLLRGC